jgi:hypothetical protein
MGPLRVHPPEDFAMPRTAPTAPGRCLAALPGAARLTCLAAAVGLALLASPGRSAAADRYWSPTCLASFWTDTCWTSQWNLPPLGTPPTAGDRAILRHVGANNLLVQYSGNSLPLAGLEMDALGTGALTLLQAQDSLDVAQAALGLVGQIGRAHV